MSNPWRSKVLFFTVLAVFAAASARAAGPKWTLVRDVDCVQEAPVAEIGKSEIVTGLAGKYRQAGPAKDDRFAYYFKLGGGKRLVRLTVEYPDDAVRLMLVSPSFPKWPEQAVAGEEVQPLGSGFMSGMQYRPSNRLVPREFVFFSPQPELCVVLQTGAPSQPAAAARIKLEEAGPDDTYGPAAPVPSFGAKAHRHIGLYWEDPVLPQDFSGWAGTDAAEFDRVFGRATDYMAWSGQDLFVYPVIWYGRTLYQSAVEGGLTVQAYQWPYYYRNHPAQFHKQMAAKCSARGMTFVPAINTFKHANLLPLLISKERIVQGEPSIVPVDKDGGMLWNDSWGVPPIMNALHPSVQAEGTRLIDEICGDLCGERSFGGVQIQLWNVSPYGLGPGLTVSYDDWTVSQFCKDRKLTAPGDPKAEARFKQRADWILNDAGRREAWVKWRCDRMTLYYKSLADHIAKSRAGAKLYLCVVFPQPLTLDLADPVQMLRERGIDLPALSADPHIVIDRMVGQLGARARQYKSIGVTFEEYDQSPWFQRQFMGLPQCAVTMHQQYFESHAQVRTPETMLKLPAPWGLEANGRCNQPLPVGRHFLAYYARSLWLFDPDSIAAGGFDVGTLGAEPEVREFATAFRALPAVNFQHVDGGGDVELRTAQAEGKTWFYAVNVADTQVDLVLNVSGSTLRDAVTGQALQARDGQGSVLLKPYELRVWQAATDTTVRLGGPFARVASPSTQPAQASAGRGQ